MTKIPVYKVGDRVEFYVPSTKDRTGTIVAVFKLKLDVRLDSYNGETIISIWKDEVRN